VSQTSTIPARILIVGGSGAFGRRVAERLARSKELEIIVAGRDEARAAGTAAALRTAAHAKVAHAVADAGALTPDRLARLGSPTVVINASGPFQTQDYALARAAIDAGCHYIDLADARAFVSGITLLDADARQRGVLVTSGASTVPALSSAVIAAFENRFSRLEAVEICISPGNSFDPGEATTASVLSYAGRPIEVRTRSGTHTVHGWQGLCRRRIGALGPRWMGHVEVPDLDLLPVAHPGLEALATRAGAEVPLFHFGLWGVSWLVRAGILRTPERLARPLLALKRRLSFLGTDAGGMTVSMRGRDLGGTALTIGWHLIARRGHGPYVPALAAVVLARKLVLRQEDRTGAMPCFKLVTLGECLAEAADLAIETAVELA